MTRVDLSGMNANGKNNRIEKQEKKRGKTLNDAHESLKVQNSR